MHLKPLLEQGVVQLGKYNRFGGDSLKKKKKTFNMQESPLSVESKFRVKTRWYSSCL